MARAESWSLFAPPPEKLHSSLIFYALCGAGVIVITPRTNRPTIQPSSHPTNKQQPTGSGKVTRTPLFIARNVHLNSLIYASDELQNGKATTVQWMISQIYCSQSQES